MPYRYLEDSVTADATFMASGANLDELFTAAGEATVNVMLADLWSLALTERREILLENEELDLLLRRFLDEIVFIKDAEGLLLLPVRTRVEQIGSGYRVAAELAGEAIDPTRHELVADVKAVTLYDLAVEPTAAGWSARVTLDV